MAQPLFMRRLRLADVSNSYDPGARLVSAADAPGGMSFEVTGGWSSDDPGDGPHWTWRLRDVLGYPLEAAGQAHWTAMLFLGEYTPPDLASDLQVLVGLTSGDAEDIDAATCDGQFGGIEYTAGQRKSRIVTVLNDGYVAGSSASGTANNAIRGVHVHVPRCGLGATLSTYARAGAVDSSGGGLSAYDANGAYPLSYGADPFVTVALTRRAATAGNASGVWDIQVGLLPLKVRP
jgi:hypothetical protein